jgi:ABC-type multidrug transport system permease subunit
MLKLDQDYYTFIGVAYTLAMTSTAVAVLLGSYVEQPQMAIEMLPLLFVPQFLFAGFFVATDLIPPVIRWAQYLCSMLYAIRLAVFYEFGDCTYASCESLLASNNVQESDVWWYWLVLLVLFATFRLLALFFLRKKATKFL